MPVSGLENDYQDPMFLLLRISGNKIDQGKTVEKGRKTFVEVTFKLSVK
jgi:hypothetical protein